jgi:DNA polymerase III subunit delta'
MQFKDVIGQEEVKRVLRQQAVSGRLPHALLLAGETGYGTMALALALASFVLCDNRSESDSCGNCSKCTKADKLIHPDLHFSYPIIKKSESTTSDTYQNEWREFFTRDKYFDINDWLTVMKADKKQALIPEAESQNIIQKLSLSPYEGGWKVMIIWLPEKMGATPANTLLKTLEEPTGKTLFILCSEHPEQMLTTVLSRSQRIDVPPVKTEDMCEALTARRGVDPTAAANIARISKGNYLTALRLLCDDDEAPQAMLNSFTSLMRMAYSRNVKGLMEWSDNLARQSRDEQKQLLAYMQNMIRENFMYNFGRPELNFMNPKELAFAKNFAPYINERNIIRFAEEFQRAQDDITNNVNSKTVLFNLALQTTILIRSK